MICEGKGNVAPAPVVVHLEPSELRIIKDRAVQQAIERDYSRRSDAWGQGLASGMRFRNSMDLRPEETAPFVGMVGEYALCVFLNRNLGREVASFDDTPRQHGDGGVDVSCLGLSIQVKTRTNPDYPSLVKRAESSGRLVPLVGDIYVFALYRRELQEELKLLGFVWVDMLKPLRLYPARKGSHFNIEIPDTILLPMSRLVSELRQRKERS